MSTHQPENEKSVHLTVSKDDEVAIRQRADRVGKQLGEVAANLISEIMIIILSGKIQTAPTSPNPILTVSEAAKILRISKSKVYRMIQVGEIPSVKFDRTSRVRHQDLDDFIQKHAG
jgi:excisionase family DNA binding protein